MPAPSSVKQNARSGGLLVAVRLFGLVMVWLPQARELVQPGAALGGGCHCCFYARFSGRGVWQVRQTTSDARAAVFVGWRNGRARVTEFLGSSRLKIAECCEKCCKMRAMNTVWYRLRNAPLAGNKLQCDFGPRQHAFRQKNHRKHCCVW